MVYEVMAKGATVISSVEEDKALRLPSLLLMTKIPFV
jgi:hypothetical protein